MKVRLMNGTAHGILEANPLAIERFVEFFKSNKGERDAFGKLALSTGNIPMAAIAVAAERRLSGDHAAKDFARDVAAAALDKADVASASGDFSVELEALRAGFLAALADPDSLGRLTGKVNSRLAEELERDPVELEIVGGLIGIGGVKTETLHEVFDKASTLQAHRVAEIAANAIAANAKGKIDKRLLGALRARTRELLVERNAEAACAYFLPLKRMASEVESVAVLSPRVARLTGDQIKALLKEGADWQKLDYLASALQELDGENPLVLRMQALEFARKGLSAEAREKLDALVKSAPDDWRLVLADARAVLKQTAVRPAIILFDWLREHGLAEAEAAKVRLLAMRARLTALRDSMHSDDVTVLRAASDVLELEPDNARALWFQGRALMRQRKPEESLKILRQLLLVSPAYPGAADLVLRLEKKRAS